MHCIVCCVPAGGCEGCTADGVSANGSSLPPQEEARHPVDSGPGTSAV